MSEHERKRRRAQGPTPRQLQVLVLVLLGYTNQDIAVRLGISGCTARDHVSALLKKSGVRNRLQLVALYSTAKSCMKGLMLGRFPGSSAE